MEKPNQEAIDSENAFVPEIERRISEIDELAADGIAKIESLNKADSKRQTENPRSRKGESPEQRSLYKQSQ